jgi:hypothetical protein
MQHNEYKKMIQLSFYGELSSKEQADLNKHLKICVECREELENQKTLLAILSENKNVKVNDEILSSARYQLRGALRMEKDKFSFTDELLQKLIRLFSTPARLAFSFTTVMLIGILIGTLFLGKKDLTETVITTGDSEITELTGDNVTITNLSFIDSDPSDGEVEFTFEAVKPVYVKGKVNDPKIQSILTYSMLNESNPGSRLNSINAMYTELPKSFDKDVKDAIITVVMTDENPGIRREALKLMNKIPYDEEIKQAYLFVLTSDSSSGLRIEALNALIEGSKKGTRFTDRELNILKQNYAQDDNNYIKLKTRTILQEYN